MAPTGPSKIFPGEDTTIAIPINLCAALLIALCLLAARLMLPSASSDGLLLPSLIAITVLLVVSLDESRRYSKKNLATIADQHQGTVEALAEALKARDDYTHEHSTVVADMVEAVGKGMKMSEVDLKNLRLAALLHDVGKVGIPDPILHKQGTLTEAERQVMETHPEIGARILAPLGFMEPVVEIVLSEHERWDGRGYPRGLKGNDIPLGARIIFVCDAYHAMTSDRPYRDATDSREAARRLREAAGGQFDPAVVAAFMTHVLGQAPSSVIKAERAEAHGSLAPGSARI